MAGVMFESYVIDSCCNDMLDEVICVSNSYTPTPYSIGIEQQSHNISTT